jgi:hypothetical protein
MPRTTSFVKVLGMEGWQSEEEVVEEGAAWRGGLSSVILLLKNALDERSLITSVNGYHGIVL